MTIFTLTSARSGTLYLKGLFENNVKNCVCRHEPFFDMGNPTLFGRAIYDAQAGRIENIRSQLAKKRDYIQRLNTGAYLESSHAFLKSAYLAAFEFFPDMQLIHLVRNPLKVAKSEAYREEARRRIHAPFHYYRGDDRQKYFVWSLTGKEPIFEHFDLAQLSLFQRYLIQWIEIENRAITFLNQHSLESRCFEMGTPEDLNDPGTIRSLFRFLGLEMKGPQLVLQGRKNRNLGHSTRITEMDIKEFQEVIAQLPATYLDIFNKEPYRRYRWSAELISHRKHTSVQK